ncbi:MAG: putative glycolipid-binding domain-containing protein [Pyrinomonadaceae bacterium]
MRQTILWRGIDRTGHEYCSVYNDEDSWFLSGVAVFLHEDQPCRLEYVVQCDSAWNTLMAKVSGWVGNTRIDVEVTTTPDHRWFLNGGEQPSVSGCIDVDLNFSAATNLLPIRRLNLPVGREAKVNAAWLRFPDFELERLEQTYSRVNERSYGYESGGGEFVTELTINQFGLVTRYPPLWEEETT